MSTASRGERAEGRGGWGLRLVALAWVALWGCGGGVETGPGDEEPPSETPPTVAPPPPPAPPPPRFQPGFNEALRGSRAVRGVTTFRLRVPVGRAGERVRLVFRSGEGALRLRRAMVARAGPDGSLASPAVEVTFSGAPGFRLAARERVVSDAVSFPVGFREELAVSFEVEGALAASTVDTLPGGFVRSGAHAGEEGPLGGSAWGRAAGLATVSVEGPPSRAFVALGDSITEGYVDGQDDLRDAWPALTEERLGEPVVNAGVSGQGLVDALRHLEAEVLALEGVTDCVVLLGSNNLAGLTEEEMEGRMSELVGRLEPFCHVWVGTLLPKERTSRGSYERVKRDRLAFNAWLRATWSDLIDFEAVMQAPESVHRFRAGLGQDGIHPSEEGQRVMADEAARVLSGGGGSP